MLLPFRDKRKKRFYSQNTDINRKSFDHDSESMNVTRIHLTSINNPREIERYGTENSQYLDEFTVGTSRRTEATMPYEFNSSL